MISSNIAILKMNNMARFDPLLVLCSLQIVQNNHLDIGDILSLKNYTQVTAVQLYSSLKRILFLSFGLEPLWISLN